MCVGWAAHRELEGLEEQLVGQQVNCQLLIAKCVYAVGRPTRRRAHLKSMPAN